MSLLLLLDHKQLYSRGTSTVLPTTNATLATQYSVADLGTVAADDSTYVGVTGEPYLLHQFQYTASTNTQPITVTWNGNSTTAPSLRPVYLQLWNNSSSLWVTIASNNTAAANTDFTLTGSETTALTDWYGFQSYTVRARVYQ